MRDLSVARSKYVLPPAHRLCSSDEAALSSSPQRRDCCFDARCERRPTSRSSASRRTARSDCARPQWGAGRASWCAEWGWRGAGVRAVSYTLIGVWWCSGRRCATCRPTASASPAAATATGAWHCPAPAPCIGCGTLDTSTIAARGLARAQLLI